MAAMELGGVLLSKFGCLLTEVYTANGRAEYLNPRHPRGATCPLRVRVQGTHAAAAALLQGGGRGAVNASRTNVCTMHPM